MEDVSWPGDETPAWFDRSDRGDYCTVTYVQWRRCRASGHGTTIIGRTIGTSGAVGAALHCTTCGDLIHHVKKTLLEPDMPLVYDHSGQTRYDPCEVCGNDTYTERHHWAPRHLFGNECDQWPTAPLCRDCHVRWHQTVTPNMGKRQKAS